MEEYEANIIKKHFSKLIETTRCSSQLLAFLVSKEVIGFADVDELESIPNESAKSMKFYRIMMTKSNSFELLLNALKETKQTGALSILTGEEDMPGKPAANNKCIRFDISHPVPNFSGRESELMKLHEKMKGDKNVANTKFHIVSVLGLGGIGKTELCRRYIHKYSDYFDGNLIWIDAHREAAILKCFQRLAEHHLQLPIFGSSRKEKEAKTIVDEVYQSFAEQKCLFIFDNADCVDYLKTYLPIRVLNPIPIHVLITSRNKEWDMAGSCVVLNEMTDADAIEFVKNELGMHLNDERQLEDTYVLTNMLQQFPLALQQCVSFIKQQRRVTEFEIAEYIDKFESNKKHLLNSRIPTSVFGDYSETTFTTWRITTAMIQSDEQFGSIAVKILNIISYFETEMIPLHVLKDLEIGEETAILPAIELLIRYSMVNSQPGKATLNIHKLVQDVTKQHLREQNNEVSTLRVALKVLDRSLCFGTVYHAISAYFHALKYKELVIEFSSLSWVIVFACGQGYMYSLAQYFKNVALEQLHIYLPGSHIDILRTELHWGIVEFLYCNYEVCLPIFEALHTRYLAHTSAADLEEDIAYVKHYIACTSIKLGKLTNSLDLALESLEACRKVHGKTKKETVISLHIVALNFEELGSYNEALSIYKHCIKLCKVNEVSEFSINILATMQSMAHVYLKMGRLDKAFSTASEIHKRGPRDLYKRDVKFFETGNILAYCFFIIGQYAISSRIANEMYTLQNEVFGDDHVTTLNTLQLLGNLKYVFGRHDEALLLHEHAYSKMNQKLGKFHELTLIAQSNVSTIYSQMGMHDEALQGFKEILAVFIQTEVPNKHFNLTKVQRELGRALVRKGNYNEALKIFVDIETTIEDKFGRKHCDLEDIREDIQLLRNKTRDSTITT